jgi:hypothetical protein
MTSRLPDFDSPEIHHRRTRLFSISGIGGAREAEVRATAALLSTLEGVREFGRLVVKESGGSAGRLTCFAELSFEQHSHDRTATPRPDGLIRCVRGKKEWIALVEVKVGKNRLDEAQVRQYHELACEIGASCLVTISNDAPSRSKQPPVSIDGRRARRVPVVHWSWHALLTEARILATRKGVADEDQAWILDEWIRYVLSPEARIIEPPSLGTTWSAVLKAAREGTLAAHLELVQPTLTAWLAYLEAEALRLRAELAAGVKASPEIGSTDPTLSEDVIGSQMLRGQLRVSGAAAEVAIEVDLRARTCRTAAVFKLPAQGRTKTRLSWFVKQIKHAGLAPALTCRVIWKRRTLQTGGLLKDVCEDVGKLLVEPTGAPVGKDDEPRRIEVSLSQHLTKGRGKDTSPVLAGISSQIECFYRAIVEDVTKPVARAPRLPAEECERSPVTPGHRDGADYPEPDDAVLLLKTPRSEDGQADGCIVGRDDEQSAL